jgi:hypothetical protein
MFSNLRPGDHTNHGIFRGYDETGQRLVFDHFTGERRINPNGWNGLTHNASTIHHLTKKEYQARHNEYKRTQDQSTQPKQRKSLRRSHHP